MRGLWRRLSWCDIETVSYILKSPLYLSDKQLVNHRTNFGDLPKSTLTLSRVDLRRSAQVAVLQSTHPQLECYFSLFLYPLSIFYSSTMQSTQARYNHSLYLTVSWKPKPLCGRQWHHPFRQMRKTSLHSVTSIGQYLTRCTVESVCYLTLAKKTGTSYC